MIQLTDIDIEHAFGDVTVHQVMGKDGQIEYRPLEHIPPSDDPRMGGLIDWDKVEAENRRASREDAVRRIADRERMEALRKARTIATGSSFAGAKDRATMRGAGRAGKKLKA